MSDAALKTVRIPLAIPDKYDDALLSLFMGASGMDSQQYADYVNRFIAHYPDASDGYVYRARLEVAANEFAKADEDMKKAVKVAEKKDEAHYQYALLIYQKEMQSDQPYAEWSLQRALEESKLAYASNPQPVYRLQQAQILYSQKQYDESYAIYEELSKGVLRGPDIFLAAAQCKLQKDDKRAAIAQLDSAISTFSRPYVKTAAPYLRAHAQLSMELRRYQLAINDMNDLVALEPNSAELWAEKASYELRVNLFDAALSSAQEVLRLDPQSSDGYLMTGIVQCQKGNKQEGMQNLRQAQSLGNPQAETFLQKYKD
jgi:tetratricopeptide (TPR) repeat protein